MKARKGLQVTSFKLEKRFASSIERDVKASKLDKTPFIKKPGAIIINVPILVDFKFDGKRVIHPIGYRIDFDKWEQSTQQVKRNNKNRDGISAKIINDRIKFIEEELPKIYNDAVNKRITITKAFILNELKERIYKAENINEDKPDELKNVIDVFEEFIKIESDQKEWTGATKGKMETLKKHLQTYNSNLMFEDITNDMLENYIQWQRETLGFINSTNKKYYELFMWFLNWATEKGYNANLEYKAHKHKFKGHEKNDRHQNIVFLTWEELMHLYNFDFSSRIAIEQVRDIYCFCAFTSLRYSDILKLKKSDIKVDDAGDYYIQHRSTKDDDDAKIHLNKYAVQIWQKYKDVDLAKNKAFPVISNQKFNENIKTAGKLAEIKSSETIIQYKANKRIDKVCEKWEVLTHKTARKTFITNAINLEIPIDIIIKWTGHSDHNAMKPYINIIDKHKKEQMKKFNK